MGANDLVNLSPREEAILFAYGRLVVLLDKKGCVSAEEVVADLRDNTHDVPEAARGFVLNIAQSFRSPSAAEEPLVASETVGISLEDQVGG